MELEYDEIPSGWPVCFLNGCPLQGECLRHKAGLTLPPTALQTLAVTPAARKEDGCPMFFPIQTVRVALGFTRIFKEVKQRHAPEMRARLARYLGGNGTYYRYRRGERPLMPGQQQWIKDLFSSYGYTEEVAFDAYRDVFRFYND
jgi:hypothetical protein